MSAAVGSIAPLALVSVDGVYVAAYSLSIWGSSTTAPAHRGAA